MRFDGWVPTVTGHLSFTAIGGSSFPSKCVSARNNATACVSQNRDLLDVVLPYSESTLVGRFVREYFANLVIGVSGQFCFATCLDRCSGGQEFSGKCYMVPLKGNRRNIWRNRRCIGGMSDYDDNFPEYRKRFEDEISRLSICTSDIRISRTGHVIIEISEMPILEGARDLDRALIAKLAANQIFYFLKDISHVHQHHDPKQDAITEVTPFHSDDPYRWVEKTQNALYREIIKYKRFKNEKSLFRASGVLSYAKSFENSIGVSAGVTRPFNTDELETSLRVSREELQHNDQKKIAEIDSARNWFFALFGFVVSVAFLVRAADPPPKIEVDDSLIEVTRFLAGNPIPIFFLILFVSFVTSFLTHRRDPARFQLVRAALRWTQGFRMRWYFLANVLFTMTFSAAFYFFLVQRLF